MAAPTPLIDPTSQEEHPASNPTITAAGQAAQSSPVEEEADDADDGDENVIADNDSDSGYSSTSGSYVSLASSNFSFIYEHGHRYHSKGEALLPNDEAEQDRLDLQHQIFLMILDGELTSTHLNGEGMNILDIGCGTGIWAMDMGDKFPSSTVLGVDESPIQPNWLPPNVTFELDDVTKPWLFAPGSFDFIHIRTMAGCIADWPKLLEEAYKALKPGGHIEVADIVWHFDCQDGTLKDDSASNNWANEFHRLSQQLFGVDFAPSPKMEGWLLQAGFNPVTKTTKIVPVGPWPKDKKLKELGYYFLSQMLEGGMENYSMGLFTKAGWAATEVHAMLGKVRTEIQNPKIHAFTRAWFLKGIKPEA